MSLGLTARQKQALDVIRSYHAEYGRVPSCEALAIDMGLSAKSKDFAYQLRNALIERGYLVQCGGSLRLVHLPIPTHPLAHGWRFIPADELGNPGDAA